MKKCYICKRELEPDRAEAVTDYIDRFFPNVIDAWEALVHCIGGEEYFTEDGRTIVCTKCIANRVVAAIEEDLGDTFIITEGKR